MNANIAVIGMGVMGSCLALNMANHNFKVSVYNYTPDLTDKFIKNHPHKNITAYYDVSSPSILAIYSPSASWIH